MSHVYVSLERDADGYPPYDIEEIDAAPLGDDRFRIDGIPVFVFGLSKGDIVRVVQVVGDERPWVTDVAQSGGHWTACVIPFGAPALEPIAQRIRMVGADAYATPFGLVAVDVAPTVDATAVMALLDQGCDTGEWDYDLGVIPD